MTKSQPNTRRQRIESLAAIAFGRAPDGGPEKGWQRKISRALGVASSTITATLELNHPSPPMDRKLASFCDDLRLQMQRNQEELAGLQYEFSDKAHGAIRPYLVHIKSEGLDAWHAAFAESAGDLAAAFILDEGGDYAAEHAEIKYDDDHATATVADITVRVRHMPKIFEPLQDQTLAEARALLAKRGKKRERQVILDQEQSS